MHEVGFAQTGVTVNEQRVKGLRRSLGHRERRRMGKLVVGADDEILERVPRVERARVGAFLVESPGPAGGRAQTIGVRGSTFTSGIDQDGGIAAGTTGGAAMADLQRHRDQPAGSQAKALGDEIQVVVVDPDRREIIGHAERYRVLGRFEANDGFKPHLENVLGKSPLKSHLTVSHKLDGRVSEGMEQAKQGVYSH